MAADFGFRIISEVFAEICTHFTPLEAILKPQFSTLDILMNITHCFNEGTYSNACKVAPNMCGPSVGRLLLVALLAITGS